MCREKGCGASLDMKKILNGGGGESLCLVHACEFFEWMSAVEVDQARQMACKKKEVTIISKKKNCSVVM